MGWPRRVPPLPSQVMDRQGKRLGTVYLGQMPEPGQGTLTDHLSSLLREILSRVDSQGLRLVYISDEGHHPSTYYHRVLKKMTDPRRPWRRLEWIRIVDFYHACQYVQQLADAIFGAGPEAQKWAKEMRRVLKTKGRWGGAGVKVGVGTAARTRSMWAHQGVRQSLCLPQKAQFVDALRHVSAPEIAFRIRDYRGRVQDRLYPAASSALACPGRSQAAR